MNAGVSNARNLTPLTLPPITGGAGGSGLSESLSQAHQGAQGGQPLAGAAVLQETAQLEMPGSLSSLPSDSSASASH